MNRNDLFGAMEFIDEKIIENSEVRRTVVNKRKFTKGTVMLAAALCLLTVFATAVFAANLFGLRDLLINTGDPEIESEISLSGYTDSREYMAASEWLAFVKSYDPDGTILEQVIQDGSDVSIDDRYMHYNVYTQEMADRLDEIAAKYGLSLYGGMMPEGVDAIAAEIVVNDREEFSDKAYNTVITGYMYDCGTFQYDGIFNPAYGRLSVDYQLRRSVKGVFDTVILNIGDIDDYQEQVITTDSGLELAAAVSEYKSVLIAESDSCFVCINVMGGTGMGITFDDLKDLANTFDFSVIDTIQIG